jgi:hypothetical protein
VVTQTRVKSTVKPEQNDNQLSLVFANILPPEEAKVPCFLLNSLFFKGFRGYSVQKGQSLCERL